MSRLLELTAMDELLLKKFHIAIEDGPDDLHTACDQRLDSALAANDRLDAECAMARAEAKRMAWQRNVALGLLLGLPLAGGLVWAAFRFGACISELTGGL
jgi:hypothetical protein